MLKCLRYGFVRIRLNPHVTAGSTIFRNTADKNFCTVIAKKRIVGSTPPLSVRLAIVGSAVTLATPLFTISGLIRVWQAVLPKTSFGRAMKAAIAVAVGGGVVKVVVEYAWPLLRDHSDLVLPFAVCNGLACMLWQAALEATIGLEGLASVTSAESIRKLFPVLSEAPFSRTLLQVAMNMPLGGALLGALTAATAPLLWPWVVELCWEPNLKRFLLGGDSVLWLQDWYYSLIGVVGLPVGILSGISLHMLLRPVVMGVPPHPWPSTALPALAVSVLLCALFYNPSLVLGRGASFENLYWITRTDPQATQADREVLSVNILTGEHAAGPAPAIKSQAARGTVEMFHTVRDPLAALRRSVTDLLGSSSAAPAATEPNAVCSAEGLAAMKLQIDRRGALVTGDRIYNAEEVRAVQDMFGVVDILVRRRYLLDMLAGAGDGISASDVGGYGEARKEWVAMELKRVSDRARNDYSINDLAAFHKEVDIACLANSRCRRLHDGIGKLGERQVSANDSRRVDETLLASARRKMLAAHHLDKSSFVGSADTKERIAVHLLANNLQIYEQELRNKINVVLASGDSAQEEKIIADYHSYTLWTYVGRAVKASMLVALPLCAIYYGIQATSASK